jgi:hypothetical protein
MEMEGSLNVGAHGWAAAWAAWLGGVGGMGVGGVGGANCTAFCLVRAAELLM